MAKYHLVHSASEETFFNLTRLEMVNKLRQSSDLHHWHCWYPGLENWKPVTHAHEVKEWMANTWTENQSMPPWQNLFSKKTESTTNDFEIVEFSEAPVLTPPPLPEVHSAEKTEFVISGFSGQVFDFDESLKDKHLDSTDFKIINVESPDKDKNEHKEEHFEKTAIIEAPIADFEKTVSGYTHATFDKTSAVEINPVDLENTRTSTTTLSTEETITNLESPVFENTTEIQNSTAEHVEAKEPHTPHHPFPVEKSADEIPMSDTNKGKSSKHDRRYPRVNGRLRTIITNKSKAFMTFTKDLSLGGIQVENNIPHDILNSEIEVYLSDPTGKKSILFRCHPVGDLKNPCRFSFAKADEKNLLKLNQWIEDLTKSSAA